MERREILMSLAPAEAERLEHEWRFWARPNQLAPAGGWAVWLLLAGRGFGKTRTGAEWVRERVKSGAGRVALVAETAADARDVMVEGESGLLAADALPLHAMRGRAQFRAETALIAVLQIIFRHPAAAS